MGLRTLLGREGYVGRWRTTLWDNARASPLPPMLFLERASTQSYGQRNERVRPTGAVPDRAGTVASSVKTFAACALLILAPAVTRSSDGIVTVMPALSRLLVAQADEQQGDVLPGPPEPPSPPTPPPSAPPAETPPTAPFADEARSTPPPSVPPGQWVYAEQYGWVWMPYADDYAYVPPDGTGEPCMYVFYPAMGWTWVVAPWVWGFGPWPHFGTRGPSHFAWYRHGWWRSPRHWNFSPMPSFVFHGVRAVPHRGSFVLRSQPTRHTIGRGEVDGHSEGGKHGGGGHR